MANDAPDGTRRALAGARARLDTAWTWDGIAVAPAERAELELRFGAGALEVRVEAPRRGDPQPPAPPGSLEGLWEHEAVELFLLGADERYLEVELGPHGHHLVLSLHGRRRRTGVETVLAYEIGGDGARWWGRAAVPLRLLPPGLDRVNAYAVWGPAGARRHLAWRPVPGPGPDFHRLECFGLLREALGV